MKDSVCVKMAGRGAAVIVCLSVLVCGVAGSSVLEKPAWKKQLGTVEHPKTRDLSETVRVGDVVEVAGEMYRSKLDGEMVSLVESYGFPQRENTAWRKLEKGSFSNPFYVGDDLDRMSEGDIVMDKANRQYHRVITDDGKVQLVHINEKANWMDLLRDEIGDLPLGDVITPGTHDTGTAGIDADSFLVDRNPLFVLAQGVDPQILANWSLTQESTLGGQLEAGFRGFDMRIADIEEEDGSFRWWHGTTGYEIQLELAELTEFLDEHPNEVVRLNFGHFARPGNIFIPTLPIPDHRKDIIADILLDYLEPYLVSQDAVSDNPTMNEVLAAGGRVIAIMRDSHIQPKHAGFWTNVVQGGWSGRTNPEDLFLERSNRLRGYKETAGDSMSEVSGCNTPDESMIIPGLLRVFGHNETLMEIVREIFPDIDDMDVDRISFEGLWMDLISFTRYGTNTAGMWSRPAHLYTSGASVHYRGVNEMVRYWLARPHIYKLNEIHVDDGPESSTVVDTAIVYHTTGIPREVTVAFQGNSKDGFYYWSEDGTHADGGMDGLQCTSQVPARYQVTSAEYGTFSDWADLESKTTVNFQEGEFPPDSTLTLQVLANEWLTIYENNISSMIEDNLDLYLRAADLDEGSGYAYTSYTYNLFGSECSLPPEEGFLELIQW